MVSSLLYDKNIKTCSLVIACLYICSWYSNSGLFNTKLKRQGFSLTSCRCKSVGIMMNCCWDMWVRTYCCWGIWLGVHSYWVVWWGIFRGLYSYRGSIIGSLLVYGVSVGCPLVVRSVFFFCTMRVSLWTETDDVFCASEIRQEKKIWWGTIRDMEGAAVTWHQIIIKKWKINVLLCHATNYIAECLGAMKSYATEWGQASSIS